MWSLVLVITQPKRWVTSLNMPHHYKQYKPGSPEYKKAYAEHMVKKLKKKRQEEYDNQAESSGGDY